MRILDLRSKQPLGGQDVAVRFYRLHPSAASRRFRSTRFRHPLSEFCGRKLAELVDFLNSLGPDPQAFGSVMSRELWLSQGSRLVTIRVDWPDYSPLKDGEPDSHYRIEVRGDGKRIAEARAATLAEAEQVVRQAFGR